MTSVCELNRLLQPETNKKREVIILGASGSVGRQAFEICAADPDKFKIRALVSGRNIDETINQALISNPEYIVMADEVSASIIKNAVKSKVLTGEVARNEVIGIGYDVVISAIPGLDGLVSTFKAIASSKIVAFANKESIIYAGDKLIKEAKRHKTAIIPIDSEHNSIFQMLDTLEQSRIDRITLTASGGALLNRTDMENITVRDVLKHPNWKMGKKITVDSATLMNKALEVIEASYLFDISMDDIDVIIHPESIVHGIVKLKDGSAFMHASPPDMKLPISYALNWPEIGSFRKNLDLINTRNLTFLPLDNDRFPLFKLAVDAAKESVESRVIMNYANEIAVNLFLENRIEFRHIYELIKFGLEKTRRLEIEDQYFISNVKDLCDNVRRIVVEKAFSYRR